jgi:hypothetical protein
MPGRPIMPASDDALTMLPPHFITLTSARAQYMTPLRFTAIILSHVLSFRSSKLVKPSLIPAMLAAPVRLPNVWTVELIQLSTASLDETSGTVPATSNPCDSSVVTTSFNSFSWISPSAGRAPVMGCTRGRRQSKVLRMSGRGKKVTVLSSTLVKLRDDQ